MKANVKKIKKYRRYSDDFKKQVVNDYESGTHSTWELSQLHGLGQSMIYKWIYKFSKFSKKGFRVVEKSSSSDKKIKQLVNEKKELLAMLAKKQIRIEYLEKMIDLTGEEYGIDIKKNLDTQQFRENRQKMNFSLNALYDVVSISKQAVDKYAKQQKVFNQNVINLIAEAEFLREEHPGCGVEKMYYTLNPEFIGRDRFIELFMSLGFRLKKPKNYYKTTKRGPIYYPNLIKGLLIHSPSQVWQSDITYYRIGEVFFYVVFIIDVYTKKIVGYKVSDNMRAEANMTALKDALVKHKSPIIHHSDRGSQYIYKPYIKLLKSLNTNISMGLTAMDNACAERINQTIKHEYLKYWQPNSFKELEKMTKQAVENYNTKRLHNHVGRKTPIDFEREVLSLPVHNRPMAIIYTDGQPKMEVTSSHLPFYAQQNLMAPNCPIINS